MRDLRASGQQTDRVAERLEQAIVSGEIKAGTKLTEQVLTQLLGVGRGPLREAIRTLEARRLLERSPFAGVRVVDLDRARVEELLYAREALEGMACRLAAEQMNLADVMKLRGIIAESRRRIETGEIHQHPPNAPDHDFHVQIAIGSRNAWLRDVLCHDLFPLLQICRFRSARIASRMSDLPDEHTAIVDAIERRHPDEAERLMRAHVAASRKAMVEQL